MGYMWFVVWFDCCQALVYEQHKHMQPLTFSYTPSFSLQMALYHIFPIVNSQAGCNGAQALQLNLPNSSRLRTTSLIQVIYIFLIYISAANIACHTLHNVALRDAHFLSS